MDAEVPIDMPWHNHGNRPTWRPEVKAPPTRAQYSEYAMAQNHENSAEGRITKVLHLVDEILQRIEGKIDADRLIAQRLEYKIDKVDRKIDVIRTQLAAPLTTCCSCWMCLYK